MITIKQIMSGMVDDLLNDSELQIFIFDDDGFVIFDDLTKERLKKFFTLYQQVFNSNTFDDKQIKMVNNHIEVGKLINAIKFKSKKYKERDIVDLIYDLKFQVKSICYSNMVIGFLT